MESEGLHSAFGKTGNGCSGSDPAELSTCLLKLFVEGICGCLWKMCNGQGK